MTSPNKFDPTIFTRLLTPEMAGVVGEVAATIEDVEIHSITALRQTAMDALDGNGIFGYGEVDLSRIALAARLEKMAQAATLRRI